MAMKLRVNEMNINRPFFFVAEEQYDTIKNIFIPFLFLLGVVRDIFYGMSSLELDI